MDIESSKRSLMQKGCLLLFFTVPLSSEEERRDSSFPSLEGRTAEPVGGGIATLGHYEKAAVSLCSFRGECESTRSAVAPHSGRVSVIVPVLAHRVIGASTLGTCSPRGSTCTGRPRWLLRQQSGRCASTAETSKRVLATAFSGMCCDNRSLETAGYPP